MSTYIEIVLILQKCITFTRFVLSVVSAILEGGGLKPILAMRKRQKTKRQKTKEQDKITNVVVIGLLLAIFCLITKV